MQKEQNESPPPTRDTSGTEVISHLSGSRINQVKVQGKPMRFYMLGSRTGCVAEHLTAQ